MEVQERNKIFNANRGLVTSFVNRNQAKYYRFFREFEQDIIQDLNVYFLEIIDEFDPSRGASLSTWVFKCFHNRLMSIISQNYMSLRLPQNGMRNYRAIKGFVKENQNATLEEISQGLNHKTNTIRGILSGTTDVREISDVSKVLMDFEEEQKQEALRIAILRADTKKLLKTAQKVLPKRHHEILMRYYLEDVSMPRIAKDLGVSRQCIHQIIRDARQVLREELCG